MEITVQQVRACIGAMRESIERVMELIIRDLTFGCGNVQVEDGMADDDG